MAPCSLPARLPPASIHSLTGPLPAGPLPAGPLPAGPLPAGALLPVRIRPGPCDLTCVCAACMRMHLRALTCAVCAVRCALCAHTHVRLRARLRTRLRARLRLRARWCACARVLVGVCGWARCTRHACSGTGAPFIHARCTMAQGPWMPPLPHAWARMETGWAGMDGLLASMACWHPWPAGIHGLLAWMAC